MKALHVTLDMLMLIGYYRREHPKECFYCGRKLGDKRECEKYPELAMLTRDHVVPKKNGGAALRHKRNIVPACQPCNIAKGHMTLEQFRNKRFAGKCVEFHGETMFRQHGKRVGRLHKV